MNIAKILVGALGTLTVSASMASASEEKFQADYEYCTTIAEEQTEVDTAAAHKACMEDLGYGEEQPVMDEEIPEDSDDDSDGQEIEPELGEDSV